MTKVLFIGLATYSKVGGLQNFNRRLLSNLNTLVQDAKLADARALLMDDTAEDDPRHPHLQFWGFGRDRRSFLRELVRQAKSADILLVGHINLLLPACLAKILNPKVRTTLFVHGDDVWNDELRPRRAYEPLLLKLVDQVASVSRYTAGVMQREYQVPDAKFTIFPNAIDEFVVPQPRPREERRVLCVTRIGPGDRRKNVDKLILAAAELRKRGAPITLSIVGDGVLRPELEQLAVANGAQGDVEFLGRVSDDDLNAAYDRASVFALPSSKEGFGIVYLEAWRHGIPVICGMLGAPKEIVTHGLDGLVADESDTLDLADKIDFLLSNPLESNRMGRAGAEKASSHYVNKNALENLQKLLMNP